MSNARHCVTTGNKLYWIDGNTLTSEERSTSSLLELWQLAYDRRVTHTWVLASPETFTIPASQGDWSIKPFHRHNKPATVSIWRRGRGQVNVIFPHNTGWEAVTPSDISAPRLLGTVTYLQEALGVSITGSPGGVGWEVLKTIHPEWIEELPVNLRDLHFTAKAGGDLIWQHESLKNGSLLINPGLYLHKWDRRSAYPYVATQTDYGKGTPEHLEGPAAARAASHEKGHPQEVGVWRVTIKYDGTRYNPDMPPVWKEEKGSFEGSEGWVSGPIIRLLRSYGHEVMIHEGWVFPERHDLLAKWANFMMAARENFADPQRWKNQTCARLAAQWAKQCANATIGFTAFKGFEEGDDSEKRRPDIRLQTVARQREILRHNIQKVYDTTGQAPIMIYMDAVYYLSDSPRLAFPCFQAREDKPGGMRYEGAIEITPEVARMFARRMAVADRLEVLNKIGWTK